MISTLLPFNLAQLMFSSLDFNSRLKKYIPKIDGSVPNFNNSLKRIYTSHNDSAPYEWMTPLVVRIIYTNCQPSMYLISEDDNVQIYIGIARYR